MSLPSICSLRCGFFRKCRALVSLMRQAQAKNRSDCETSFKPQSDKAAGRVWVPTRRTSRQDAAYGESDGTGLRIDRRANSRQDRSRPRSGFGRRPAIDHVIRARRFRHTQHLCRLVRPASAPRHVLAALSDLRLEGGFTVRAIFGCACASERQEARHLQRNRSEASNRWQRHAVLLIRLPVLIGAALAASAAGAHRRSAKGFLPQTHAQPFREPILADQSCIRAR